MKPFLHSAFCVAAFAFVAACGSVKKQDAWNMYEIHPASYTPAGRQYPVDNDSYYSVPTSYSGCATINDAPSCPGG